MCRKKKTIKSLCLIMCFLLAFSVTGFAAPAYESEQIGAEHCFGVSACGVGQAFKQMLEQTRAKLLGFGMPAQAVADMEDAEVLKYVNASKVQSSECYYQYDYQITTDPETGEETATLLREYQVSKAQAEKNAAEQNQRYALQKQTQMRNQGASQTDFSGSTLELYILVTNNGGDNYLVTTTYQWLSYPLQFHTDVFAVVQHERLTKVQNSATFNYRADVYKPNGDGSMSYVRNQRFNDYSRENDSAAGYGYTMMIPARESFYSDIDDTYGYLCEHRNLRGYLAYTTKAQPGTAGYYDVSVWYGHQLASFAISGISLDLSWNGGRPGLSGAVGVQNSTVWASAECNFTHTP